MSMLVTCLSVASLLAALTDEERSEVEARGPVAEGALSVEYDAESL